MTPLTHHLLTLNPSAFQHATQNKFLQIAGNGTLPKVVLEKWLAQDRLYAQAYVRFASHLISTIPLPVHVGAEDLNERVLDLFLDALNNVWRELKFFGDVAREYGLDITAREEEEEGVKGYRRLFDETGGKSMAEALVLLWGTEKVCCFGERSRKGTDVFDVVLSRSLAVRRHILPRFSSGDGRRWGCVEKGVHSELDE